MKILVLVIFTSITILSTIYMLLSNKINNAPLSDDTWIFDIKAINNKLSNFLSSSNEHIISILGIKYAAQLLNKAVPDHGFCVLTDKAFYFMGNIYQKKYFLHLKSNVQHKIKASEIKAIKTEKLHGVKFLIYSTYIAFRFIWIIRLLVGWLQEDYRYSWMLEYLDAEFSLAGGYLLLLLLAGPFVLLFALIYGIANLIFTSQTLISIEFASETFGFPVDKLGANEIKAFYKDVNKVQETVKNERQMDHHGNQEQHQPERTYGSGKIESLKEISKLYEQNMISLEEFERLKKEILGTTNGNTN